MIDARIVMDMDLDTEIGQEKKEYSHLALQPYPEKYVSRITLDNTDITLRPIKPEDEPLWLEMLSRCSKESIYSRFRYMFHWNSHQIATKFCYIDYDREIAIVAEIEENNEKHLIGVGRLIADPEHETVEYAVLIVDAWQFKDLGNRITDFCLNIANRWNLKKVVAQTTTDNHHMIKIFQKRGFDLKYDNDSGVDVLKEI